MMMEQRREGDLRIRLVLGRTGDKELLMEQGSEGEGVPSSLTRSPSSFLPLFLLDLGRVDPPFR